MRLRRLAVAAILATSACYHQIVNTGQPAGTTTIHKEWVSTWFWGLVAADPIDVSKECPSGLAVVETQMSFMNGLGTVVTLGIWSPRDVSVTCASRAAALPRGAKEFAIAPSATLEERIAIVNEAIATSGELGAPVVLRFTSITH